MTNKCCEKNSKELKEILKLKEFLKIVSDTNRLRILCLLSKKELCVCEIFEALQLPQNLVSHHLAKLEKMSLLKKRKEGTFIIYSINQKSLKQYKALFNQIIKD
jgi:ArsR family transcriptional regulator, arsenate/arsenite/antimonite-responsive transcriptional repressor